MKDEGRGFSPRESQFATGTPSEGMRGRTRRLRFSAESGSAVPFPLRRVCSEAECLTVGGTAGLIAAAAPRATASLSGAFEATAFGTGLGAGEVPLMAGFGEGSFDWRGEILATTFFFATTDLAEDFFFEDLTAGLAGLLFDRLAAALAFGRDVFLTAVFVPAPPFSFPCTFGMRDLSPTIGGKK